MTTRPLHNRWLRAFGACALAFATVAVTTRVGPVTLLAQAPDRSKPPVAGPAPTLKLPQIQKRQLSNGLPVWIVEMHEVPVVQANLVVMAGSADDPADSYGLASFTSAMLTEGAGSRSALEIADAVDFLGADLSAVGGIDSSSVRLHVPVARLADALPILADVALRPTFPKDDIDRLRDERLTMLLQARDDSATLAAVEFSRAVFGAGHRFGNMTMGSAATIRSFTSERLRAFYQSQFRPDNAVLLVVGDVTPDAVVPLLETSFGKWTASGPKPPRITFPPVAQPARREVYLVDTPGSPQSQIRIGRVGVARSTPDYFPIEVANTLLGGSFSSRLNMNLREEHGYSYGAASAFDMRVQPGPLFATAGVQTDKTSESLTEFFKELNGMAQPVPADELSRAKNYVSLRFPGGFETTSDITRRLEEMLVYHLPDDYFSTYVPGIDRVTAADIQRVARTYIQPDRMAVVVVGDLKTIEPGIRALNLGPVHVVSVDEIFGAQP